MGDIGWKTLPKKDNCLEYAILPSPFILPAFWNETVMTGTSAAILVYESTMKMDANTKDKGKER